MWRALALGAILTACGGDSDTGPQNHDAGPVLRTALFTPMECTYGIPGDPRCPTNNIDLPIVTGQFDLVAQPQHPDLYLTNLQLIVDPNVHIDGLYVELWWAPSTEPRLTRLAASVDGPTSFPPITIRDFMTSEGLLSLRFDAISVR